jgi:hypothetical protein
MRDELSGLLGQARTGQIGREEPGDAEDNPYGQQRSTDDTGPGVSRPRAVRGTALDEPGVLGERGTA